jgi:hypothetical protein
MVMVVGTLFTGPVGSSSAVRWFSSGWPAGWNVIWTVVSTTPVVGAPQVEWDVAVERATASNITYWITVRNLTSRPVNVEGRYAVMNI